MNSGGVKSGGVTGNWIETAVRSRGTKAEKVVAPATAHISTEELLRVFCLGDIPLVLRRMDGSSIRGRVRGLKTDECVGPRGSLGPMPDWVVSIVTDENTLADIGLADIASLGPPDMSAREAPAHAE